jgi:L-histidine N-alpha-methyltransferase
MRDALAEPDVRIESYLGGSSLDSLAADVREGLTRDFKELPPKYFYDERGSALFDRITELPEYYPTRAERAMLNRRAPEIVGVSRAEELVELGSGSASKSRTLLYAMAGAGTLRRYVPMDVSETTVERCSIELIELFPGLQVHGVIGDFEQHLRHLPDGERRLFAFLGGTIGNFYPEHRARFLSALSALLEPGDHFLLGVDLVKSVEMLEAAYNDAAGVTAEFNRNVLHAINRELGADFRPDAFEHVAFYDGDEAWIEMRLRAVGEQRVRISALDMEVVFEDGEEMRTEISAKFTPEGLESELSAAGFAVETLYPDAGMFALVLAAAR